MKRDYIIIQYDHQGTSQVMKTIVNGKEGELPEELVKWIARTYILDLLS